MPNLGVIILAAGGSTRMGEPKQLLKINGKSLIRKTVETAMELEPVSVLVVLGHVFQKIQSELAGLNVGIVNNKDWQKGMAGSLRIGVQKMLENEVQAVLILVCDQPHISSDYLKRLYESFQAKDKLAIASFYNSIKGVPAIFNVEVLKKINTSQGDFGARHLIKELAQKNQLAFIPFLEGAIDLDTPEDYARFLENRSDD